MNRTFRFCIDGLVILMAGFLFWTFVGQYYLLPYEDETTPDDVRTLDEEIDAFSEGLSFNFEQKYENPNPLDSYAFVHGASAGAREPQENYADSVESIVYITTYADGWVYFGTGSILTHDGVILTNHHVIVDSEEVVVTLHDGTHHAVTDVLAYDAELDVAFLKIDGDALRPMPIGDASTVRVGDPTLVIGHAEGYLNSLSLGNVSGVRDFRSHGAGMQIQITNPISMGNSGGAVINEYGEIIGVPSWSLEYQDNIVQVQNINFAVPIDEALAILE